MMNINKLTNIKTIPTLERYITMRVAEEESDFQNSEYAICDLLDRRELDAIENHQHLTQISDDFDSFVNFMDYMHYKILDNYTGTFNRYLKENYQSYTY